MVTQVLRSVLETYVPSVTHRRACGQLNLLSYNAHVLFPRPGNPLPISLFLYPSAKDIGGLWEEVC